MLPFQQCLQEATYTDQCLTYNSLHDQSAIISQWSAYTTGLNVAWSLGEKKYLAPSVLVSNGYPFSFVQKNSQRQEEPEEESLSQSLNPPLFYLMSKVYRSLSTAAKVTRRSYRSDTTLRSHLNLPKDTVVQAKRDGVVYRMPCECGYIGGMTQGDLCWKGSKNTTGIYDLPVPRPRPFWTRPRDWPISDLEQRQVYWSRSSLVHT